MLQRITRALIWVDAWMIALIGMHIIFNPTSTDHPHLLSFLIGVVAYFFAYWVTQSAEWLRFKIEEKLFHDDK